MQMATVREAVASAARTVVLPAWAGKLTCSGYTPDAIVAPHFFCGEYSVEFDKAMGRALDVVELTCRVLVSRADDKSAQQILDLLLSGSGTASLKAAMVAARGVPGQPALDGAAHDVHLMRIQGYRWYEHAGAQYVGAELILKIIGEGA
jgi:hypothetical protein